MQAHDSRTAGPPAAPVDAPETLRSRVRRLSVYFGNQRLAWSLAIGATLLGAVTEPLIPALLKPLLDRGFTQGSLSLWVIPLAIMGVFLVRGAAQFVGQYALTRIANEGMLILRNTLFERLLSADMALFSRQSAGTGPPRPVARWLYAVGTVGLPALFELAIDTDRGPGGARGGMDHENALTPPL